jgi:uncharacterized protein (TIGR03083 family)
MSVLGDDRYSDALRGFSARLARLVAGDQQRPVPTCPGWTFRELAIHVGRAQRWGAEIVATRATQEIPPRQAPDGKLPATPAERAAWLQAGAGRLISAVATAPEEPVWTLAGIRPARYWLRRLTHEGAVHRRGAARAGGQPAARAYPSAPAVRSERLRRPGAARTVAGPHAILGIHGRFAALPPEWNRA